MFLQHTKLAALETEKLCFSTAQTALSWAPGVRAEFSIKVTWSWPFSAEMPTRGQLISVQWWRLWCATGNWAKAFNSSMFTNVQSVDDNNFRLDLYLRKWSAGGWLDSPLSILPATLFLDKSNKIVSAALLTKLLMFLALDKAVWLKSFKLLHVKTRKGQSFIK